MTNYFDGAFADSILRFLLQSRGSILDQKIAEGLGTTAGKVAMYLKQIVLHEPDILIIQEFGNRTIRVVRVFEDRIQYFLSKGGFEKIAKDNQKLPASTINNIENFTGQLNQGSNLSNSHFENLANLRASDMEQVENRADSPTLMRNGWFKKLNEVLTKNVIWVVTLSILASLIAGVILTKCNQGQ